MRKIVIEFLITLIIFTTMFSYLRYSYALTTDDGFEYKVNSNGTTEGDIVIPNENIPTSVTNIDQGAFKDSRLTSIIIPGTVKTIGTAAFQGYRNLKNVTIEK